MKYSFIRSVQVIAVIAIAYLPVNPAFAELHDFQTWGNITATGSLDFINPNFKNFKYWMEGQGRFGNDASSVSQAIIRPGLGYQINEQTSIWLGYAWVPTDTPFTKTSALSFDENRIWQQLLWSNKFEFGTLTSRSRLEQRFIPGVPDTAWRFRQMLKLSIPMPFAPSFSFVASDEFFTNINRTNKFDDGFDQNRAFAGIGYNFNKNIKTEVGYMNQFIRRIGPDRMDHILSVNLYLNY